MSMAYVGVAVAVIGAAMSAYSSYAQGENAKEVADYNAGVEKNKAVDSANRANVAADEQRGKVRKMMGAQRAAMGANGTTVDTGSNLSILTETAGTGELDALRILNNGSNEFDSLSSQSSLTKTQGQFAKNAGTLNAGASLLSSASSIYGQYKTK
jgi:hypothetical protein